MIIEGKLVHIATIDPESSGDDDEVDDHFIDARSRGKSLAEFRFRVEEAIKGNYLFTTNDDDDDGARLWGVEATDAAVLSKFLKAQALQGVRGLHRAAQDAAVARGLPPGRRRSGAAVGQRLVRERRRQGGAPPLLQRLGREYQRNLMSMGQQSCNEYLRWRLLCLEKGIRRLNFQSGGVDSIVQIVDMRHAGGPTTKEMKLIGKKMIALLHDHYPGIVHKNVSSYRLIINVPSWFLTLNALKLRLVTKRSKNKFIFVKQSRVTETLLKYATIENTTGSIRRAEERENDTEFTTEDKVLEAYIRANGTELIQIPVERRVRARRRLLIQDLAARKRMGEGMRNSFYIREEGRL
ncbi:hypothetical protein SASPL_135275 [Salvia splendens]|uniref:CRAL-TRIO domain-containing protein n=1 Tax=Salvia splendens TaxID=180675 RepID=A0A8X8WXL8_SALSN|nr:hypothetical protein SASPL_135275 [Salvia splendens]